MLFFVVGKIYSVPFIIDKSDVFSQLVDTIEVWLKIKEIYFHRTSEHRNFKTNPLLHITLSLAPGVVPP